MMDRRQALTVKFPDALLAQAKAVAAEPESLNDLVVEAVEREVRRRRTEAALARIHQVREKVLARTGPQPDPVPLIRALRQGDGRRG
jgi:hypothetical protein